MEEKSTPDQQALLSSIDKVVKSPIIPRFYANGFVTAKTSSDMFLIGQVNGAPLFILNMSFASLKNLHTSIDKMVKDIEKEIGEIKILESVNEKR